MHGSARAKKKMTRSERSVARFRKKQEFKKKKRKRRNSRMKKDIGTTAEEKQKYKHG